MLFVIVLARVGGWVGHEREQGLVCPILTIILYYVSVYFVYPEHNVTVCLFALTLVRISANLSINWKSLISCSQVLHSFTTWGCGLMVGVLILHPERSGLSNSPNKAHVVHVILTITITWRGVDELTPETPFLIQKKKKKVLHLFSSIIVSIERERVLFAISEE